MTTLDLIKSGTVTLDGNGYGTIVMGPERGGESWTVTRISVQSDSALQSKVRLYRNVISTLTMLFDSKSGNSDVASGNPPLDVPRSGRIVIEWTDGTPGAHSTAVLEGKLTR